MTVPQFSLSDATHSLSPTALAVAPRGEILYVACATDDSILAIDLNSRTVTCKIPMPARPLGFALSRDEAQLFVACTAPRSSICVVDTAAARITQTIPAGHTAMSPVLSLDERVLYVCHRFDNEVAAVDLGSGKVIWKEQVRREPVAAVLADQGKLLLVANHLHSGRSDGGVIGAVVTVIEPTTGCTVKEIQLPRGSSLVRDIAVSPDSRFAAVTHLVARYYLPTSDVGSGQINANALSFLDLNRLQWIRVLYLDQAEKGAANPWALAWSPDGQQIAVTQAGSHELTLVEAPIVAQKSVHVLARIPLIGQGPRAVAFADSRVWVANYFSDNLNIVDLTNPSKRVDTLDLGPRAEPCLTRRGEELFNDARLCYQQWQSCASCHDADGRVDGLNWDLLNDGQGNPKNARSLVWAHRTPPSMALGVRVNAESAVRAGLQYILFTQQPDSIPQAIDEYLRSLQPEPSPALPGGRLSPAAQRGEALFLDGQVGCVRCHPGPLFTDMKRHQVGTSGPHDQPTERFDTPALVELWRTAPYLHDGSAATLRDVLTGKNRRDLHGRTSHLSPGQISDLAAYLSTL